MVEPIAGSAHLAGGQPHHTLGGTQTLAAHRARAPAGWDIRGTGELQNVLCQYLPPSTDGGRDGAQEKAPMRLGRSMGSRKPGGVTGSAQLRLALPKGAPLSGYATAPRG